MSILRERDGLPVIENAQNPFPFRLLHIGHCFLHSLAAGEAPWKLRENNGIAAFFRDRDDFHPVRHFQVFLHREAAALSAVRLIRSAKIAPTKISRLPCGDFPVYLGHIDRRAQFFCQSIHKRAPFFRPFYAGVQIFRRYTGRCISNSGRSSTLSDIHFPMAIPPLLLLNFIRICRFPPAFSLFYSLYALAFLSAGSKIFSCRSARSFPYNCRLAGHRTDTPRQVSGMRSSRN